LSIGVRTCHRNNRQDAADDCETGGEVQMKLDMHCHTKEGSIDGNLPLLENIQILRDKGYQGMLITDHDSYKAYSYWEKLEEKPLFVVLRGIEYDSMNGGHILIVLPTGVRPSILSIRGLPVSFLIDVVHHYGGICGPAHPYGEKFMSLMNTWFGKHHEQILKHFDFLESFNACESRESNNKAEKLAEMYGIPGLGGSDSHRSACAGLGYTELERDILTEDDLIEYIKTKKKVTSGGDFYLHTTKQKIGRANYILVYLFWFYNRFLGYFKAGRRHVEIKRTDLKKEMRQKRDAGDHHYITIKK